VGVCESLGVEARLWAERSVGCQMLIDRLLQRLSAASNNSFLGSGSKRSSECLHLGPKQNRVSTYFKHMDAVSEYRVMFQEATAVRRAILVKSLACPSIFPPSRHILLPTEQATKATTIPNRSVVSE
jgi:hypothetical protein